MYLYFAAKIRKSIHIMAYQCIKKQKVIPFPILHKRMDPGER